MFLYRLMDEPTSRYRAARRGDGWFGYSREVQELHDLYNLMGVHVQVSGGRRRVSFDHVKEPPAVMQKPARTIADLDIGALGAQINA